MKIKVNVSLLLFLMLTGCASMSLHKDQTEGKERAREAARLYFEDLRNNDMQSLSKRIHAEELEKFKSMFLPLLGKGDQVDKNSEFYKAMVKDGEWETLSTLSAEEFFVRFMSFLYSRPVIGETFKNSEITILGEAAEDDIIHVVYRMRTKMKGVMVKKIAVISIGKDRGAWKVMLTGELENLLNAGK